MSQPIILALDTSGPHAGFAAARGGELLASLVVSDGRPHSETLFGNLSRLLEAAGLALEEVDLFAAAAGPGSFTGLRVGLSALQGLADAGRKPALGVDTLSLLALAALESGEGLIMCGAGRKEVYAGGREILPGGGIRKIGEDLVGEPASVAAGAQARSSGRPLTLVVEAGGSNSPPGTACAGLAASRVITIDRANVNLAATLALFAFRHQGDARRRPLEAYYVRPSDAEIKRPK
ncbi:MAG: tRNA (adenosine(37)-N6)-threonylcarbamoyltransferase complex dimerization subunit type 1 TsaB [Blastocatellia bacterium]